MERTDEELVVAYRAGESAALRSLIGRYTRPMYTFVYRTVKDTEVAEDLVQEVFVKVWKSLKKFKTNQRFKTWIYTIARNTVIDWLRKKRDVVFSKMDDKEETPYVETLTDENLLADALFEKEEIKSFLLEMLDMLSEEVRMVVVLHSEGLTFEEIAEITGRPMNTIKSQYRRALDRLREVAVMHQKGQNMRI